MEGHWLIVMQLISARGAAGETDCCFRRLIQIYHVSALTTGQHTQWLAMWPEPEMRDGLPSNIMLIAHHPVSNFLCCCILYHYTPLSHHQINFQFITFQVLPEPFILQEPLLFIKVCTKPQRSFIHHPWRLVYT